MVCLHRLMKDVKAELVRNTLQNCSKLNNKSNCTGFLISEAGHPGLFHKTIIVENFAKFTRKHLCQSLQNIIKKKIRRKCFPVNLLKFWTRSFSENTSWRLRLSFASLYLWLANYIFKLLVTVSPNSNFVLIEEH